MLTEDQFIKLYTRDRSFIRNVCLRFCHNSDTADDLTEEVFTSVWRKKEQFKGLSKPRTWVYRIAVNHCLMQARNFNPELVEFDPDIHYRRQKPQQYNRVLAKELLGLMSNLERNAIITMAIGKGTRHPTFRSQVFRARKRMRGL